jgi:hypothetical protein
MKYHAKDCDFDTLLSRAREGDRLAGATLHQKLAPHLVRIVRRALRDHDNTSPLGKRVMEEAQQVGPASWQLGKATPDLLIDEVAQRLSNAIWADLTVAAEPQQGMMDTVRGA